MGRMAGGRGGRGGTARVLSGTPPDMLAPPANPRAMVSTATAGVGGGEGDVVAAGGWGGGGGGGRMRAAARGVAARDALTVYVMCPRCRALLEPPGALFRCPCGQLMTYEVPSTLGGRVRGGGGGPMLQDSVTVMSASLRQARIDIEMRMQHMADTLPPDDQQARFLRTLLRRLPRYPDGTIEVAAVEDVIRAMVVSGGGGADGGASGGSGGGGGGWRPAPRVNVDALPTHAYRAASAGGREHAECAVCLSDYEDGDMLRTLPCAHAFHRDCIDRWLGTNPACPLCRVRVD